MSLKKYANLVVLSHSVFALPFALWGFTLAVTETSFANWGIKLLLVVVAVVSARTAAMAFNRYVDRAIDARNPRTAQREIPRGEIAPRAALFLVIGSGGIFIGAAWLLSPLCAILAPVALFILLGYSYTKRFTYMAHYVLGIALGLAPVGAYLAGKGEFSPIIWLVGVAVALWVGGFDILYALQDEEFDRENGLYSIPATFGEKTARRLSLVSHFMAIILLLYVGFSRYGWKVASAFYWIGWGGFSGFILYQHLVSQDKSKINRAFFTYNGLASVFFGMMAIVAELSPLMM
ncbi:MAG: putative 4-hydroxybenzoate polyprenyltransferase [Bacteroidia bacterium]|nr:putative 4-hydroxybenzoate polyprenyltransferase [Bacteroidia bacterium]MCX7651842.1 putative 4-hydroxybenzoate polyprenyltransferase [Bacteroidia bacterium]MDW8416008.1 4-hydroxybenzoate octaprenyltransferase [Bacteroidia bacterium]